MSSGDDQEGDEPLEPHSTTLPHPPMPMHVYPFPHALLPSQQPLRSKRRQVKNACTHCQKACKKCDDARPCLRCVKYGISEECVDSQRKERKKGIKRGPYKKRDGKGSSVDPQVDGPPEGVSVSHNTVPPLGGQPIPGPYLTVGYPPAIYGQYPPKQGDGPPMYSSPPYFLASVPHIQPQHHPASDVVVEAHGYPPPQGYYQAAVFTPMPYHHQYSIPRQDGAQYPIYAAHLYPKQHGEMVNDGQELVNGKHG